MRFRNKAVANRFAASYRGLDTPLEAEHKKDPAWQAGYAAGLADARANFLRLINAGIRYQDSLGVYAGSLYKLKAKLMPNVKLASRAKRKTKG